MVPELWSLGRSCSFGLAAPIVKATVAVPWQVLQALQSAVSTMLAVWSVGRSCSSGLAAPMVKATVAVPWQVLQVEATKAWVACVMFMGPKVPAAYVVVLWQELQSTPEMKGMC